MRLVNYCEQQPIKITDLSEKGIEQQFPVIKKEGPVSNLNNKKQVFLKPSYEIKLKRECLLKKEPRRAGRRGREGRSQDPRRDQRLSVSIWGEKCVNLFYCFSFCIIEITNSKVGPSTIAPD